jgi:hypothetical protein
MKRTVSVATRTAFLLAIALILAACNRLNRKPPAPTRVAPHPFDVAWEDRSLFAGGLVAEEQPVLDRLSGATIYHMDLNIADNLLRVDGHQEVHYTNREDVPLDQVCFRLYPNVTGGEINVSDVRIDGFQVKPTVQSLRSAACVRSPVALQPGESTLLSLDFGVTVPQEMGGNYGLFGYFEDVLVLDTFYPAIAVYDDEGWNIETPARNGDLTYYDASFYLVRITAPGKLTFVASGIEVGREIDGKRQILTYAAGPARDFYLAASERFVRRSEQVGETAVHSYAFAGREEGAALAMQHATSALKAYNARIGDYAYTEMDIVSTPMLALGIEYPGTMGITLKLYDPEAEVSGLPAPVVLESVVAHEVGHQWFYNAVGNDQQDEPWLDEAIVQYVTGMYYLDVHGPDAAKGYRTSWTGRWDRVDRADTPIGLPAGSYAPDAYSPIVYGRGPFFVSALAKKMGQETFDAFLSDYYQRFKWEIATGEAFKQLAETHCQCDLTPLFEEWVYPQD